MFQRYDYASAELLAAHQFIAFLVFSGRVYDPLPASNLLDSVHQDIESARQHAQELEHPEHAWYQIIGLTDQYEAILLDHVGAMEY